MMPIEEAVAIRQSRTTQLRQQLAELLAQRREITLEIGCGHGHFMTGYAAAHPDEFCVAIDIIRDRLERADRKARRAGLGNIAWVRAHATDFLEVLPAHLVCAHHIFILFPDPWPKRRHWKNRLVQPSFLSALANRAAPGTLMCFRTDHAPYFAAAAADVAEHPDWEIDPATPWPFEERTVFESRAPAFQSLVARRRDEEPTANIQRFNVPSPTPR